MITEEMIRDAVHLIMSPYVVEELCELMKLDPAL